MGTYYACNSYGQKAKIKTNIYIIGDEKINSDKAREKFKERIKKYKKYNEEFILEELYNYILFSEQLRTIFGEERALALTREHDLEEKEEKLKEKEKMLEKWKAMYTGQCEANKILVFKLNEATQLPTIEVKE
jgi:hypothetical protein